MATAEQLRLEIGKKVRYSGLVGPRYVNYVGEAVFIQPDGSVLIKPPRYAPENVVDHIFNPKTQEVKSAYRQKKPCLIDPDQEIFVHLVPPDNPYLKPLTLMERIVDWFSSR